MKEKLKKNFSIIDHGLTVEGAVSGKGQLVIKGTVKGSLEGDMIIIAEEGAVYADTKAQSITIGGMFEGILNASADLNILSTGNCNGEVTCKDLVVESGGKLNAKVTCTTTMELSKKAIIELPKNESKSDPAPKTEIKPEPEPQK
ncbi:MAG: polymer-forming cytoskeletal protein [Desulfobacteraceae bacterium]